MSLTPCDRHLYTDHECYVIYESTKLHDCPLCRAFRELEFVKQRLKETQEALEAERNSNLDCKCNLHDLQIKHTQAFNELLELKEELAELLDVPISAAIPS